VRSARGGFEVCGIKKFVSLSPIADHIMVVARSVDHDMHIFGGSGYLVDETPLGSWWRDMKLARVGGGTDEVLGELVAAAMKPDYDGYADLIKS
jgi:alkylation response protein AidB-like acyl-CoA dehydrogenase